MANIFPKKGEKNPKKNARHRVDFGTGLTRNKLFYLFGLRQACVFV